MGRFAQYGTSQNEQSPPPQYSRTKDKSLETSFMNHADSIRRPSSVEASRSFGFESSNEDTAPLFGESSGTRRAGNIPRIESTTIKQKFTTTWASSLSIFSYLVMMVVCIYDNGGIENWSTNPMLGPSVETMVKYGANSAPLILYKEEYWRFITPTFLHAGLIHLGFNVYVQYSFGSSLEAMWGTPTWIMIFFVSGFMGNLGSAIFMPTTIGVGASGAIMGMLGGWFLELFCHWKDDDPIHFEDPEEAKLARKQRKKMMLVLFANIVITFALSIVPMVDWAAHVFGCIGGMIAGAFFFQSDVIGVCKRTSTLYISAISLVGLTAVGLWYFFNEVEPCPDVSADGFTNYLPPVC